MVRLVIISAFHAFSFPILTFLGTGTLSSLTDTSSNLGGGRWGGMWVGEWNRNVNQRVESIKEKFGGILVKWTIWRLQKRFGGKYLELFSSSSSIGVGPSSFPSTRE